MRSRARVCASSTRRSTGRETRGAAVSELRRRPCRRRIGPPGFRADAPRRSSTGEARARSAHCGFNRYRRIHPSFSHAPRLQGADVERSCRSFGSAVASRSDRRRSTAGRRAYIYRAAIRVDRLTGVVGAQDRRGVDDDYADAPDHAPRGRGAGGGGLDRIGSPTRVIARSAAGDRGARWFGCTRGLRTARTLPTCSGGPRRRRGTM